MTGERPIPLVDLGAQHATIAADVRGAIDRVLTAQQFILGPEVAALESDIAAYSRTSHGIGVSSGTDALLVALMALGVGPGDEVITTPYSFIATAACIARLGARAVFVDIDPVSYAIDPAGVAAAFTDRTKAVLPVHLYGQMADMTRLLELSRPRGIAVVEDAAQAIGAERDGVRSGQSGTLGTLSFFPSKNLGAAGDGGMVLTSDEALARRVRLLRNHGQAPKYFSEALGGNFRLDALQAAILRAKLPYLDGWIAARQSNASRYRRMFAEQGVDPGAVVLAGETALALPQEATGVRHVYHQFVVRSTRRDALRAHLTAAGIGSEIYYPRPLHLQTCFASWGYGPGDFPESERAARETLAIPIYPELTERQQARVVATIVAHGRSVLATTILGVFRSGSSRGARGAAEEPIVNREVVRHDLSLVEIARRQLHAGRPSPLQLRSVGERASQRPHERRDVAGGDDPPGLARDERVAAPGHVGGHDGTPGRGGLGEGEREPFAVEGRQRDEGCTREGGWHVRGVAPPLDDALPLPGADLGLSDGGWVRRAGAAREDEPRGEALSLERSCGLHELAHALVPEQARRQENDGRTEGRIGERRRGEEREVDPGPSDEHRARGGRGAGVDEPQPVILVLKNSDAVRVTERRSVALDDAGPQDGTSSTIAVAGRENEAEPADGVDHRRNVQRAGGHRTVENGLDCHVVDQVRSLATVERGDASQRLQVPGGRLAAPIERHGDEAQPRVLDAAPRRALSRGHHDVEPPVLHRHAERESMRHEERIVIHEVEDLHAREMVPGEGAGTSPFASARTGLGKKERAARAAVRSSIGNRWRKISPMFAIDVA